VLAFSRSHRALSTTHPSDAKRRAHHFDHGSLPGDGLLQLQYAEAQLGGAAAPVQRLSPCAHARRDLTLQAGVREREREKERERERWRE